MALSIIFPSFNEQHNPFFWQAVEICLSIKDSEVILCDGGSTDGTLKKLREYSGAKVIQSEKSGRAQQFKAGFTQAQERLVLLHHPRTLLSAQAIQHLQSQAAQLSWGGFTHRFDHSHPILRFTSWYSNEIRCKRKGIVYLDHGLYFRRDLLTESDEFFPETEIFEDTLLSYKLKAQLGPPQILPFTALTSSIRFQKNGILYQSLLNQILKVAFHLNIPHRTINKIYEKGLELNHRFQRD